MTSPYYHLQGTNPGLFYKKTLSKKTKQKSSASHSNYSKFSKKTWKKKVVKRQKKKISKISSWLLELIQPIFLMVKKNLQKPKQKHLLSL